MPLVLVAEPSLPIAAALRKFLADEAEVKIVHFLSEAVEALRTQPVQVLIAGVSNTFDGETLAAQARRLSPNTGLVLVYPADAEDAADRAEECGVDAFLVGPLKKHVVQSAVRAVLAQRFLRLRINELEAAVLRLRKGGKAGARSATRTGFNTADRDFFKKYLLLEVKRSRRYRYPLALLLVGLDGIKAFLAAEKAPEFQLATIRAEVLAHASSLLRDIDLAVPFAEDRILVFLPHTPRAGALTVAGRMVQKLSRLDSFPGGTASIGLAAYEPKSGVDVKVSFGGLVREATAAIKQAQGAGGNQVQTGPQAAPARRNRISMG